MRQTENTRPRLVSATHQPRKAHQAAVDRILRRTLEPNPTTADRLIRGALTGQKSRHPRRQVWQLAAAATVLLLAILGHTDLRLGSSPTEPTPAVPHATTIGTEPLPLRISNEAGPVIVTTPAGSKMIFLQKNPAQGDAS